MEHRWDVRRTVFLDVAVYREEKLVTRCFSGDLSRGGLFLETDELSLDKNSPVELDVLLNLGQGAVGFHFHASVVHCSRGGLGFMFRKTQAQLSNTLLDILSTNRRLAKTLDEGPGYSFPKERGQWIPGRVNRPLPAVSPDRLPVQFF